MLLKLFKVYKRNSLHSCLTCAVLRDTAGTETFRQFADKLNKQSHLSSSLPTMTDSLTGSSILRHSRERSQKIELETFLSILLDFKDATALSRLLVVTIDGS